MNITTSNTTDGINTFTGITGRWPAQTFDYPRWSPVSPNPYVPMTTDHITISRKELIELIREEAEALLEHYFDQGVALEQDTYRTRHQV